MERRASSYEEGGVSGGIDMDDHHHSSVFINFLFLEQHLRNA
jgi:hypothetical protein